MVNGQYCNGTAITGLLIFQGRHFKHQLFAPVKVLQQRLSRGFQVIVLKAFH